MSYFADENNAPVFGANIQVKKLGEEDQSWRQKNVTSDPQLGRYWRILLPGRYQVRAVKDNLISEVEKVEILSSQFKRLDFVLLKKNNTPIPFTFSN